MDKKNILILIQARIGSKRLRGKVLKKILGKPILWHIIERLKKIKNKRIVVATSKKRENLKIINFCKKNKVEYFAGNEKNVLDRFYQASKKFKAHNIIRITADCPLIDAKIIKKLIQYYFSSRFDHVGIATGAGVNNIKTKKFPDGMDAECFKFSALEKAWLYAKKTSDKEHVTPYIWKRKKKFKIGILTPKKNFSDHRWTLDTIEDLKFIKTIYENLYPKNKNFCMKDIISFLLKNPKIKEINKINIGKEQYNKI
jgi:spore coat polysaccharide biosynthesis protein SpsF